MVISQSTVLQTHAMQTVVSVEVVVIAVLVEQTDVTSETAMAVETDLIHPEERETEADETVMQGETMQEVIDLEIVMTDVSRIEEGTETEMVVLSTVADTSSLTPEMLIAVLREVQTHLHCESAKLWTSKEIENVS